MLTIIAAVAHDGAIGRNGNLLWHIPADLRHFKQLTLGAPVLMGRKTWESLPKRPLPDRPNIVISRNPEFKADGALTARSLEEAVRMAEKKEAENIFIIGGGQLYNESFGSADALEITFIDAEAPDADTFFPEISSDDWILEKEYSPSDPLTDINHPAFIFRRYIRR